MEKPFPTYRFSTEKREKSTPWLNPFTFHGLGLDGGKTKEVRETEVGPWNWQWHQNVFDKLPNTTSPFFEAVSRLQPNPAIDFKPVLRLQKATDEVDATVVRVNSLEASPNQHAHNGYRKNCAAAIGRWRALFASFDNQSLQHISLVVSTEYADANQEICLNSGPMVSLAKPEEQTNRDVPYSRLRNAESLASSQMPCSSEHDVPPLQSSSSDASLRQSISRVSSSSSWLSERDGRFSVCDEDCPDLSLASLSPSSTLGEFLSPELPFPQVPSNYTNQIVKKGDPCDDNEGQEGLWLDGFEDYGNTFVATVWSENEDQELDENIAPTQSTDLDHSETLLIPAPDQRANRSPLAVLYESEPEQSCSIDDTEDKAFPPRVLSPDELARLEQLYEQATSVDDWSWAFGGVDFTEDEAVGISFEYGATTEIPHLA